MSFSHTYKRGAGRCGAGWLGGPSVEKKGGAVSLDSLPSAGRRLGGRGASQQMLYGAGESWPRGPTPFTGQLEKVFAYRKFGSFLRPKHTGSAKRKKKSGLCVGKGGERLSRGVWAGTEVPPPPLPGGPLSAGRPAPRRGLCVAQPGRVCPSPPPGQHTAKQTNECHGQRGETPAPKSQTSSSCPILFSRLKYKRPTVGEQRSRAARGSTRTRGLCTTIR